jgi:hypothetical protein
MSTPATEQVHVWNRCHGCGAEPIVGVRFQCQTCPLGPDSDLCEACHRGVEEGRLKHPPPEQRQAPRDRHVFRAYQGVPRERVLPWLAVPWAAAPAPAVPDHCVVRPEFRCGRESFFGSYGFVVADESGGAPLLLTALHVLDEVCKAKRIDCSPGNGAYSGRELPQQITGVQLYDVYAPQWMLAELGSATGTMLVLPDARICPEEPYSDRDIAAFRLAPSTPVRPVRLASAPPAVGEPIWLAVNLGRGARERTLLAVVVEMTERTFIFRYPKPTAMPPFTSGAPLLNRMGEAVGINAGGGLLDGHRLGHGNSLASMRRHLGWQR